MTAAEVPTWLPLRIAWERALYGPEGFYRTAWPSDHFRTSVHTSALFAGAVHELARRLGVRTVVDVGAGRGELLTELHVRDRELELIAVELRPRPDTLPGAIAWRRDVPASVDGLLIANEVLDNVPCDVVEVDSALVPRLVEINTSTSAERLGAPASAVTIEWLRRWWPINRPGERAEVGSTRERWWQDIRGRMRSGACLAIDYGHRTEGRPPLGSLASFHAGRSAPVGFGGDRDVTADVAVDALQDAVGGTLRSQTDWLRDLGVTPRRPPVEMASSDPAGYVRRLSQAGEAAELVAPGGLGDFWWLLTTVGSDQPTGMGA